MAKLLGKPESYFREPDEARWAEPFALPIVAGRALDYRDFMAAARLAGSTPNGVFAARIMWGSIAPLIQRLDDTTSDLAAIEKAFGPVAFVHLRRDNVLEQAVSWSRAEQTGIWQDGDRTSGRHHFDLDRLKGIRKTIEAHNAAWQSWFRSQGTASIVLTYEEVVGDPRAAVTAIARHVSVELPTAWHPQSQHRKQADETNAAQVAALRQALDAERA